MKKLITIGILIIILASCKNEAKTEPLVSNFNLKKDFLQLTHKMTALDTVKVWMDLSLCTSMGTEVLTLTRKNDSILIEQKYKEGLNVGLEYKHEKSISISIHDTLWKFNEFLKRNENKITTDTSKYGRLQISHNKSRIHFVTEKLGESGTFITDYSKIMSILNIDNPLYIHEAIITTE